MPVTTLEKSHRTRGSGKTREQLLAEHLPLVYHIARRVQRTLMHEAELDDLVSAGSIGLMRALDCFDPGRGFAFSTYAAPRIRGAILDDLRRCDDAPRSLRRKRREMSRAADAVASKLGRKATEPELAQELGVPLERLWAWKANAEETVRLSIDQPSTILQTRADAVQVNVRATDSVELELIGREEVEQVKREIARLKEQERIVLTLYFFQELKLHQIARVLGLTESRISQIRTKALHTLRSRLHYLRESA